MPLSKGSPGFANSVTSGPTFYNFARIIMNIIVLSAGLQGNIWASQILVSQNRSVFHPTLHSSSLLVHPSLLCSSWTKTTALCWPCFSVWLQNVSARWRWWLGYRCVICSSAGNSWGDGGTDTEDSAKALCLLSPLCTDSAPFLAAFIGDCTCVEVKQPSAADLSAFS